MANHTVAIDNRIMDRRGNVPFFSMYQLGLITGRRVSERRLNIRKPVYVDRYCNKIVLSVIGILLLSVLDAFFTLNILAKGGTEINPFMAVLIEDSLTKFVSFKLALTALALLLLTMHYHVLLTERFRVSHIAYLILFAYTILISYELILLYLASLY